MRNTVFLAGFVLILGGHGSVGLADPGSPTGREIVSHCDNKYEGDDHRTRMTITNRNQDGLEKTSIYRRYIKNYPDNSDFFQKMLLFAEFPPEAEGFAFMRWEYRPEQDRYAEQWMYTNTQRRVTRVSEKDPSASFLGSALTLGDIAVRAVDADEHRLLGERREGAQQFWVVESIPKNDTEQYSKRVSQFLKTSTWENCVKSAVAYFDRKGYRLKVQLLDWQQVNGAWLWNKVQVRNLQTKQTSVFSIDEVNVNVGLDDDMFNERVLRRGIR